MIISLIQVRSLVHGYPNLSKQKKSAPGASSFNRSEEKERYHVYALCRF